MQTNTPETVRISPARARSAARVLDAGGLVLVIGSYFSGKSATAAFVASGRADLVDLDDRLDDAARLCAHPGAVVATCWTGSGDNHEATAATVARVAAVRRPDLVLRVVRDDSGTATVVGGGFV